MTSPPFDLHPFLLGIPDVARQLETDLEKGLASLQVKQRQAQYGRNELEVHKPTPWYSILIKQFCNAMTLVLFIIVGVSFGIGDIIEGSVVSAVIAINVSIGFYQESRSEKKMDALRSLSSPSATVIRDGSSHVVPNAEVVPGDIVILHMGDTVPADLRLFESVNLSCDEQMMTGESLPVDKVTHNKIKDPTTGELATSAEHVTDGDRINLAFASTNVSKGRGRGIVIATGMATAVGRIAAASGRKSKRKPGRSMNARKYGYIQPIMGATRRLYDLLLRLIGLTGCTPLQRRLTYMAYILFLLAVVVAIIVFGVHRFQLSGEVVLYATSTGIALIPESLSIVLIMTMVQATRIMRLANVVVRDLAAVELLGGVTNICSDKTGTLTKGAMIVKKAWLPPRTLLTVQGSTDPNDPTTGNVTVLKKTEHKSLSDGRWADETVEQPISSEPQGESADGQWREDESGVELTSDLRKFLLSCALCNAATVRQDPETHEWQSVGEPTEIALQVFAKRFGLGKRAFEDAGWLQRAEFPFDSNVKRMSVVYDAPEEHDSLSGLPSSRNNNSLVFTKGAVERIIECCSTITNGSIRDTSDRHWNEEEVIPLTDSLKDEILAQMDTLAPLGLRVLAIAYRQWPGRFESALAGSNERAGSSGGRMENMLGEKQTYDDEADIGSEIYDGKENVGSTDLASPAAAERQLRMSVERNLTFLGLVGIYDPPREETASSIRECTEAGISVHMLTGDHPATATAIAREVGILPSNPSALPADVANSLVLPATAFDALSSAELDTMPQLPLVVARCTPETKTRMIEALRRRKKFSAMTGDGVNDAPSLSRADVGIAMGSGSDVAKSAAAIVLADDRFSSIVAAVREGRRMFDNIQKFMLHLLVSNIAEVILLILGLSFQDDEGFSVFPLSALHILWINIFTSAMPALGLGMEKATPDLMHRPPHGRGIFTRQLVADMMIYGVVMGAVALLTFVAIVYGAYHGQLGHECNREWSESCLYVFRARAAVFVQLTYLILFSAWEFKDMRRSLFRLNPDSPHIFPVNVATDLWANKFLFFSVVIGLLPPIALVYIPAVGEQVLRHAPITWEWGLVFAGIAIFILAVEAWKYAKVSFGLFDETVSAETEVAGEPDVQRSMTLGPTKRHCESS